MQTCSDVPAPASAPPACFSQQRQLPPELQTETQHSFSEPQLVLCKDSIEKIGLWTAVRKYNYATRNKIYAGLPEPLNAKHVCRSGNIYECFELLHPSTLSEFLLLTHKT